MQKSITITHLISSLATGGAEKVVLSLYKNRSVGRVTVAYWQNRQELLKELDTKADDIVRVPLDRVVSIGSVIRLIRQFRRWRPDIIQTHLIDADLLGAVVAILVRRPFVVTIHSYPFPVEARHCRRYRLLTKLAARVICVSETVKKHLVENAGMRPDKISIVNNGINLERFAYRGTPAQRQALKRQLDIPPDHAVVGNVSRLIDDKGHTWLLKAVPAVLARFPRTTFLIVGDGELRASLAVEAKQLGVADRVVFAGSRPDIPQLLDIMDIFAFPTFREALGICVLEAMAMAKPIIASDDAAVPELITHEKHGLLIHPGNAEAISAAVLRFLDDPRLREACAGLALERSKDFSEVAMVRSTERIYREILDGRPRGR